MNPLDWGLLILLSIVWGGSFFFVQIGVQAVPPLTLVALRVSIAAVALWPLVLIRRFHVELTWQIWVAFLVMGVLNNVIPFTLFSFAQREIASALAAILNATTPLFTILVASIFLADERATWLKIIGVAIGFVGIAIMIGADLVGTDVLAKSTAALLAQFACLAAAFSYALSGAWGRRFQRYGIHPMLPAVGQLTCSSLVLWPIALFYDGFGHALGAFTGMLAPAPLYAILALALVSTSFAYVIFFRLLATVGATNLLLVTFLVPVTASILGIVFLGEQLTLTDLLGILLIGLGLSAIDGRLWRKAAK
ncbi:MAG: EamA family transporter [Hyphomicrobiales bacterium]|nr:MAG: EamA family transporter [Hyphomicrobiales bacterium]